MVNCFLENHLTFNTGRKHRRIWSIVQHGKSDKLPNALKFLILNVESKKKDRSIASLRERKVYYVIFNSIQHFNSVFSKRHYGVLLLYGQHLALNHLVGQNQIRILIGNNLLDQSSTDSSVQYVQQGIRLNLHCWHTNDRFSKFAFKMGHYKQSELEKFRNDTTAQAYV
jgi:hypothetical protein